MEDCVVSYGLDGSAVARQRWLEQTTGMLSGLPYVAGVWLVGSLGRGDGDAFSDVDLVVAVDATVPAEVVADPAAGLRLPGHQLYVRPKPRNAPAGGGRGDGHGEASTGASTRSAMSIPASARSRSH